MLVRDWMTVNVISLGINSSVLDAAEILRDKNIRQFPVIDSSGALVGIVSDRDIRDAMPSKFLAGDNIDRRGGGLYTLTAGDIMSLDPKSVHSDAAMTEVADLLVKHKVGGLPVVDDGQLVGIITQADVLQFLCATSGATRGGAQFGIRMGQNASALTDLLCDIRSRGIVLASVFTAVDPSRTGTRNAYVTIADMGDCSVADVAEFLGEKYDVLFYVAEGVTVEMV